MPRCVVFLLSIALVILTPVPAAGQATPAACPAASPAASTTRPASPVAGTAAARIDAEIRGRAEIGIFSGAVLIAHEGRVVLEAGYGPADRACGVPNAAATTFRIGSITKQFTAAAIMHLAEAGKLAVDDPIAEYLPDFPRTEGGGVAITIHHLLSHTSGIPEFFMFYDAVDQAAWPATVRELTYAVARDHELLFTPGAGWDYSNTGYFVLGLIVEATSGGSYEAYVRANLFEPAGMTSTGFEAAGDARPNPALGYRTTDPVDVSAATRMDIAWSAGGIFSTVGDLHRWNAALADGSLLSRESVARMETPVAEGYGYGLFTAELGGRRFVGHDGGIDGFVSTLMRFPDDGIEVIVLANLESASVAFDRIALAALDTLAPA